jgi:hypothetical protein
MKLYEFFSVPSVEKDEEHQSDDQSRANREKLANDLFWYILDNDDLHKKHFIPIAQEINRKLKKDKKVDREEYTECWMPMVKEGCLKFHKENKMKGDPKKLFDNEICKGLCHRFAEKHLEDIEKKSYKLGD